MALPPMHSRVSSPTCYTYIHRRTPTIDTQGPRTNFCPDGHARPYSAFHARSIGQLPRRTYCKIAASVGGGGALTRPIRRLTRLCPSVPSLAASFYPHVSPACLCPFSHFANVSTSVFQVLYCPPLLHASSFSSLSPKRRCTLLPAAKHYSTLIPS